MRRPRSLAGRLALLYVVALVAGLIVFAAFALITIDRVQRASADATLASEAGAAAAVVVPESDSEGLDRQDAGVFRRTLGAHANGALFDAAGRLALSTVVDLPDEIRALATPGAAVARDVIIDGARARAVTAQSRAVHGVSGRSSCGGRSAMSPTSTAGPRSASRSRSRCSRSPRSQPAVRSRGARCSHCARSPR